MFNVNIISAVTKGVCSSRRFQETADLKKRMITEKKTSVYFCEFWMFFILKLDPEWS